MIFVKLAAILAVMLFFSVFLSGGVATFMTIATYVIGHNGYALLEYGIQGKHAFMETIAHGILMIFPNLSSINMKSTIHLGLPVDMVYVMYSTGMMCLYIVVILFLAQYIFKKRSFDSV